MAQQIIFDTDPGVDDSLALLLGLASPDLEVLGVTTVFGNVAVEQTTRNALHVLEVAGRPDLPVVAGAARPLVRPRVRKASVHGEDGLGNIGLPPPPREPTAWIGGAAGFIADTILSHPGEVTLVAVAPLTNVAQAVQNTPAIVPAVRRVIVMGGAVFCRGNVMAVAEANNHIDPEAARIVFGAGWPVTDFLARILPVYRRSYQTRYAMNGIPTHDPSATAAAIDPSLYRVQRVPLYVEVEGHPAGQMVADPYRQRGPLPEIEVCVCVDVDATRLLALIRSSLSG